MFYPILKHVALLDEESVSSCVSFLPVLAGLGFLRSISFGDLKYEPSAILELLETANFWSVSKPFSNDGRANLSGISDPVDSCGIVSKCGSYL